MASGWGYLGGIALGALVVVHAIWTRPGTWTLFVRLVAVAHLAIVVELALFPLPVDRGLIDQFRAQAADSGSAAASINLTPMATIGPALRRLFALRMSTPEVRTLIGNFFLLMPLAWYGPILIGRLRNILWFALAAILFSVAIELAQLAITRGLGYTHATDVDDVIVNAGGALVAFMVLGIARRFTGRTFVPND
jgi:glycopeptide antibiotics resistance protein